MNDYKELIEKMRKAGNIVELADGSFDMYFPTVKKCHDAADAIEQLVKERDAAVADIRRSCVYCRHSYLNKPNGELCDRVDSCTLEFNQWEWRRVQEDKDEID